MRYLLTLLLALLGCGRSNEKPVVAADRMHELSDKAALYTQLIPLERAGPDGFIESTACDSTLVSGLYGAGNQNVNLLAARSPQGDWRRRSLALPDCWFSTPEEREAAGVGGSRSSFSRDMGVGLLWWLWRHRDLDSAIQLLDYLQDNDYVMGEGDPSTTSWALSNLVPILAQMIEKMGGPSNDEKYLVKTWFKGLTSYEAHLQIWLILLDAEINGGVTDLQISRIKEHKNRRPENPLYQAAHARYVSGNYTEALDILLNPSYYPADKLPDITNLCKSWPISSDDEVVWAGCSSTTEHPSGADLVAVWNLVILPGLSQ